MEEQKHLDMMVFELSKATVHKNVCGTIKEKFLKRALRRRAIIKIAKGCRGLF
jgi:hypothetical protein